MSLMTDGSSPTAAQGCLKIVLHTPASSLVERLEVDGRETRPHPTSFFRRTSITWSRMYLLGFPLEASV